MYTKQEVSKLKEAFWTTFGKYMKPVLSADGEPVSWSNYRTGIPGIQFKMEADNRHALIAIVMTRAGLYEKMEQHRAILEQVIQEEWEWREHTTDEYGRETSMISKEMGDVSVLRTEDWPTIISFFKPRIIALDEFWSMARHGFEEF